MASAKSKDRPQPRAFIVTLDGPSASGKTSVSRELATRLNCDWLSTGAFYRGLGFYALKKKVRLNDEDRLVALCRDSKWAVEAQADKTRVFIDGQDVTAQLNSQEVSSAASQVSSLKKVRQ